MGSCPYEVLWRALLVVAYRAGVGANTGLHRYFSTYPAPVHKHNPCHLELLALHSHMWQSRRVEPYPHTPHTALQRLSKRSSSQHASSSSDIWTTPSTQSRLFLHPLLTHSLCIAFGTQLGPMFPFFFFPLCSGRSLTM